VTCQEIKFKSERPKWGIRTFSSDYYFFKPRLLQFVGCQALTPTAQAQKYGKLLKEVVVNDSQRVTTIK
jgi:hypothetical protein